MKKILIILTLLVTLFAFSSCDMVEDITGGVGDSLTTLYDTKIDVEYPELPLTVSYIFMDETNSSCKITKISHELSVGILEINFYGEKTYSYFGDEDKGKCAFSWRLLDADGYVVDDGTVITSDLIVGEKFVVDDSIYDIDTNKSYTLEIYNYEV